MRRVTEMESEPVVDKFYLVPHVLYRDVWTPVMGRKHDDAEYIGVPEEHYHRDLRFTSDEECDWLAAPRQIVEPTPEQYAMLCILWTQHVEGEPTFKRRKCQRRMPEFPLELRYRYSPLYPSRAPWFAALEGAYKDASAKCGRCPHRGFGLKGLPVKDGAVTCPGHGLRWHVETGTLVPR